MQPALAAPRPGSDTRERSASATLSLRRFAIRGDLGTYTTFARTAGQPDEYKALWAWLCGLLRGLPTIEVGVNLQSDNRSLDELIRQLEIPGEASGRVSEPFRAGPHRGNVHVIQWLVAPHECGAPSGVGS